MTGLLPSWQLALDAAAKETAVAPVMSDQPGEDAAECLVSVRRDGLPIRACARKSESSHACQARAATSRTA